MNDSEKNELWPMVRVQKSAKEKAEFIAKLTGKSLIQIISEAILSLPMPLPEHKENQA